MNNKIYNNLNIENLKKTEWFNQFHPNEQKQILLGLEDNLDGSIYAKTEYNNLNMRQIRLVLLHNLNVSWYAKKYLGWEEMRQIRLGLKDNLDVSIYAKTEFD